MEYHPRPAPSPQRRFPFSTLQRMTQPPSFTPGPAIRELVSSPHAGNPHHISSDLDQAEMTGNDGDYERSTLTFRQKDRLA